MITLTKTNFEEKVLKAKTKVLVDFWASWCMPCSMLSPIIKEIADGYPQITVGKVNVDEEGELALNYRIQSIPTILIFENGKIVNMSVGVVSKEKILSMLGL